MRLIWSELLVVELSVELVVELSVELVVELSVELVVELSVELVVELSVELVVELSVPFEIVSFIWFLLFLRWLKPNGHLSKQMAFLNQW